MDRVFTPGERRMIQAGSDPDRVLWTLWAAKETGYKAVRRFCPAISSAPRRYEVQLSYHVGDIPESGTVHTPCGPVSARFCITGDYVHCIGAAADGNVDAIIWEIREMPQARSGIDESVFVREMAKGGIAAWLGEMSETIEIVRPEEDRGLTPPLVKIRGNTLPVNFSMSHDGRFAACAFSAYQAQSDISYPPSLFDRAPLPMRPPAGA